MMRIIDRKLLFYHFISELSRDKKITPRDYNGRTVYDCFKNTFPVDFGSPDLNIPSMSIDDITRPNKRALYTPDMLPASIYVASGCKKHWKL